MLKRVPRWWLDNVVGAAFDEGPLLFAVVVVLLCALSAVAAARHPLPVPTIAEVVPAGL